jgi:hypothetical protein
MIPVARSWSLRNLWAMAATRIRFLPLRLRVAAAIIAVILGVLVSAGALGAMPAQAACPAVARDCFSGSISNGGVDVGGTAVTPGVPSRTGAASRASGGTIIVVPPPALSAGTLAGVCAIMRVRPWYCPSPARPVAAPSSPARPAVTLADIARFVPRLPTLAAEPQGWAIAGLSTNFIASAVVHDVAGRLLGLSATVRFTPSSYSWSFGDGRTLSTVGPGNNWSSLGKAPFTPTETSNVFGRPGAYVVTVTARYLPSYRIGSGPWITIVGVVTKSASLTVRAGLASAPRLVTGACRTTSTDSGC